MLQQKLRDKIERLESKRHKELWTPKNCSLIKISNDMKLKPNDIFESVKRAFTEAEMTKIKGISPYLSSKNWAIQFNDEQSFYAAINKDIDIGDKQFKLIGVKQYVAENQKILPEYKPFSMNLHFRIHWLPIGFGKSKIRPFLANDADFIEVIEIEHEKWSQSEILNGVIKVKANIEVENSLKRTKLKKSQLFPKNLNLMTRL